MARWFIGEVARRLGGGSWVARWWGGRAAGWWAGGLGFHSVELAW